jgi:hypothetical protein
MKDDMGVNSSMRVLPFEPHSIETQLVVDESSLAFIVMGWGVRIWKWRNAGVIRSRFIGIGKESKYFCSWFVNEERPFETIGHRFRSLFLSRLVAHI